MRALERYLLLQIIDQRWREHLYDMDYLREGIHLRGFAQIEPIVAYKNEAFTLFTGPDEQRLGRLRADDLQRRGRGRGRERRRRRRGHPGRRAGAAAAASARWSTRAARLEPAASGGRGEPTARTPTTPARRQAPRRSQQRRSTRHEQLGRNDPCWCGSGKKFKKCHGARGADAAAPTAGRCVARPSAAARSPQRGDRRRGDRPRSRRPRAGRRRSCARAQSPDDARGDARVRVRLPERGHQRSTPWPSATSAIISATSFARCRMSGSKPDARHAPAGCSSANSVPSRVEIHGWSAAATSSHRPVESATGGRADDEHDPVAAEVARARAAGRSAAAPRRTPRRRPCRRRRRAAAAARPRPPSRRARRAGRGAGRQRPHHRRDERARRGLEHGDAASGRADAARAVQLGLGASSCASTVVRVVGAAPAAASVSRTARPMRSSSGTPARAPARPAAVTPRTACSRARRRPRRSCRARAARAAAVVAGRRASAQLTDPSEGRLALTGRGAIIVRMTSIDTLTVRAARDGDAQALRRLAHLDSARPLTGDVLLAEATPAAGAPPSRLARRPTSSTGPAPPDGRTTVARLAASSRSQLRAGTLRP